METPVPSILQDGVVKVWDGELQCQVSRVSVALSYGLNTKKIPCFLDKHVKTGESYGKTNMRYCCQYGYELVNFRFSEGVF